MALPLWLSNKRKFCSKRCYGLALKKKSYLKDRRECLSCKKAFKKGSATSGKYCSHECYSRARAIYGDKPNCLDCGVVLSSHNSKRCVKCNAKSRVGENHPMWIVDRTKLSKKQERGDMAYKEWRKQVWLRDNFKCKISNPDCRGRIEAHHILGWTAHPELRYEVNNGITLCHNHHPRKRSDERALALHFQSLLETN